MAETSVIYKRDKEMLGETSKSVLPKFVLEYVAARRAQFSLARSSSTSPTYWSEQQHDIILWSFMTTRLFRTLTPLALHIVKVGRLWNHQTRVAIAMMISQFGCGSNRRDLIIEQCCQEFWLSLSTNQHREGWTKLTCVFFSGDLIREVLSRKMILISF